MNENEIVLKVILDDDLAGKSVGELKQDFKDLNKQLENTTIGTEQYKKTLQSLGVVKGGLQDLKEQIAALNPEKQFAAIAKLGSTVANGFAAAQAGAALFNTQSEDLMKVLVKVQAATALASGLQGLTGMVKALQTARLAMVAFALSNPFTAIAAAVTAVTATIYALTRSVEKQSEAMKDATKVIDDYGDAHKNAQVKLQLLNLELQKEQGKLTEHEYAKQKLLITGSDALRKIREKYFEDNAILTEKYNAGEFKNREEYLKAFNALKANALQAEKDIITNAAQELELEYTKINTKTAIANKKEADEAKHLLKQKEDDRRESLKRLQKYEEEAFELHMQLLRAGLAIEAQEKQAALDAQLAADDEAVKRELEIRKKRKEEIEAQERYIANLRVQLTFQSLNAIQSLGDTHYSNSLQRENLSAKQIYDVKKKQFQFNKALAATEAAISTALAVQKNYAQGGLVVGSALNVAQILIGAANVAAILAKKYPAFDGGDADTGTNTANIPNISSPQAQEVTFQQRQGTGVNKDVNGDFTSFQNQQQKPIKTYMVETEASATMRNIERIENNINY